MIIRRIGPVSLAKVMGTVYALLGLLMGILFALLSMAGDSMLGGFGLGSFGLASIIVFPLLYGCVGFIMSLIMAAIYNWAAGMVGGIEIQAD